MSKQSEGLMANFLYEKWSFTHAPAAAGTVVASVSAPQSAKSAHILEALSICIKNMAAGAHTVTTSVRDTSVAGNVLMSFDTIVAAAATKEIILNNLGLKAPQGTAIHVTQNTVLASVKAIVNASGWTDTSTDY